MNKMQYRKKIKHSFYLIFCLKNNVINKILTLENKQIVEQKQFYNIYTKSICSNLPLIKYCKNEKSNNNMHNIVAQIGKVKGSKKTELVIK